MVDSHEADGDGSETERAMRRIEASIAEGPRQKTRPPFSRNVLNPAALVEPTSDPEEAPPVEQPPRCGVCRVLSWVAHGEYRCIVCDKPHQMTVSGTGPGKLGL